MQRYYRISAPPPTVGREQQDAYRVDWLRLGIVVVIVFGVLVLWLDYTNR